MVRVLALTVPLALGALPCPPEDDAGECQALCDLWAATGQAVEGWCDGGSLCTWDGVTCTDGRVSVLELSNKQHSGQLPDSLGLLTELQQLRLGENLFSGSLPASIGSLSKLTSLVLHDNQFSGSLPESIGNLSNLEQILAFHNAFSGRVPTSLGQLSKLSALALFGNNLTSWDSDALCELLDAGTLSECSLAQNDFECPLPRCASSCAATCDPGSSGSPCADEDDAGDCQALCDLWEATGRSAEWCAGESLCGWSGVTCEAGRVIELSVPYSNSSGTVPESIGNLTGVRMLFLGNNGYYGTLPESLGMLSNLKSLGLDRNKFTGSLPDSLGNLQNLETLLAYGNQLSGSVPPSLGKLPKLHSLALFGNNFTSWGSDELCSLIDQGVLTECSLADNPFVCPIPACASSCSAECIPAFNTIEV